MTPTTPPTSTTKRDDMIVHEQEPYNAEPSPSALARQALTPIDTFYARNHGPIPRIDADDWRLHVDGMVDRPSVLPLSDLREPLRAWPASTRPSTSGGQGWTRRG